MANQQAQQKAEGDAPAKTGKPDNVGAGPTPIVPLDIVMGFVTEFNANTKIFNATTLTLLIAILQMKAIQTIADKHTKEIATHTVDIASIRGEIGGLKGAIAGLESKRSLDRPLVHVSGGGT